MTGECFRCGAIGPVQQHHPTCRRADCTYYHPDFTVPFCKQCHDGAHVVLRALGIDQTKVDSDGLVLARILGFIAWMGMVDRPDCISARIARQTATILEAPLRALITYESAVSDEGAVDD